MADFNPATSTLRLTEFVGPGATVSFTSDGSMEYDITNVIYTFNKQFEDMIITWSGNSFTFTSQFANTFDRVTNFLIQDRPTETAKEYKQVISPVFLPQNTKAAYEIIPPPDSVEIPFTLTTRQRQVVMGVPGAWQNDVQYTWNLIVVHNYEYTHRAIKWAVQQGTGYKNAVENRPEVKRPPVSFP